MEGAGDHTDDEHHHAEDQHIGDDVDPLGRRILGKDAAQLAIIAPGEPDAPRMPTSPATSSRKPRNAPRRVNRAMTESSTTSSIFRS